MNGMSTPKQLCSLPRKLALIVGLAAMVVFVPWVHAADSTNMKTLTPEELAQLLTDKSAKTPKPLLLQVGSRLLYVQAHIPGSEYIGQGNTAEGLQNLNRRVSKLPKITFIVLYCGCCPWSHCPNVNPAYDALQKLGFTNVKVLYIANNFGADWADKGYPVARGF
jgi:thiosulfate/3-mercaptopyruvate sulfurtransferase